LKVSALLNRTPEAVIRIVETIPPDEVLSSAEIAAKLGCSREGLERILQHPSLADYRYRFSAGSPLWWGQKKTIAKMRGAK